MLEIQDNDYKGTEILKLMRYAKNYNNSVIDLALLNLDIKSGNIIDFGAGIGTFSSILKSAGFEVTCVEIDPKQVKMLEDNGFKTFNDISLIEDNSIENIVSFNVFEHIKNDAQTLKIIHKKLANDGKLFIFVPASQELYSNFDKKLGHYRRYEMEGLQNLLKTCGFEILSAQYFDSVGYILAKIYKFLNISGGINLVQIQIFDKFIFNISKLLDRIFRKHFGKNIAVTVRKVSS